MNIVQLKYDELDQAAQKIADGSVRVKDMMIKWQSQVEVLKGGAWVGRGSDSFYDESDNLMLPALKRLEEALEALSNGLRQAQERMRGAEQECASRFR